MASEQEIIHAVRSAVTDEIKIRILDQLGHKIKPQHRELIRFLVELSRDEENQDINYAVKRALFQIRSRYNITNFPLFLMDPLSLLKSSDPAYRIKALETFEKKVVNSEQCYYFLGAIHFEDDPFVLSKFMRVLPKLSSHLPISKIETILEDFVEHEDSRVRANAIESYSIICDRSREERIDILFECLKDSDQRVRSNALKTLQAESEQELYERTWDVIQKSQNYYAVSSCIILVETVPIDSLNEQLEFARKRLTKLEKELKVEPWKLGPQIHVDEIKKSGPLILPSNMMRNWVKYSILIILVLFIYNRFISYDMTNLQGSLATAERELAQFEKILTDQKKRIEQLKSQDKVLILDQELSQTEKLDQFRHEGKLLRSNAEAFYKEAKLSFEKEDYSRTVLLYRALYDVYKDNRLAVDSVRGLSKTQKIQNVMASVKNYLSKNQFLSADKKVQEVRHLMSKKNYEANVNRIRKLKEEFQSKGSK